MGRQASAVALKRRVAKDVDRLPHEQREQEVEGRVGVAHGCEDACLLPSVSHGLEAHLVAAQQRGNFLDRQWLQPHVA